MNSIGSKSSIVELLNEVVLQGYHKKLKTMKKKYFVLCADTPTRAARLEYYDSEKKFKSRSNPKKTIILKNCFNINRRLDTKHKYVIALSVRDGGFCIVLDSEEELNKWLRALLTLQRGEDTESEMPKPTFEHVWQVQVQRKGLAEEKGLIGSYHVCLTSKSLTLYRIGSPKTISGENRLYSVEFYLTTIRRCGDSQCYFYMEVGRHSAIGAGELWMETEDTLIAQNMHRMILGAMASRGREDTLGPMRKRSSSANEASKPISVIQRRQTHSGNKPINSSPISTLTLVRDRCDSLPSRNRTASECSNLSITNPSMPPPKTVPVNRPHSMYSNRHSHSPPINAISPSIGCSESEGSSLSIDEPDSFDHSSLTPDESGNFVSHYFNSRSSRAAIPEEKDEMWYPDNKSISTDTETPYLDKLNNHGGLSLPISSVILTGARKGSPALNSHIGSVEMQSQYMDMYSPYSPCGSSPCDQVGSGFIPTSPSVECTRGIYTGSSGGHSRASSLAEETVDGYVPMCPPQQPPAQDYVDMEQSLKHNTNPSGFSSAASSSSITSGTPSTDLKFAEYPLEKVSSRFTPDDEDMQSIAERPTRAYSVGSRVEHNKRKLRVEFTNEQPNNSRVRAFSVGSRAKVPRCDLTRGLLTYNLIASHINTSTTNPNNNIELSFTANKQRNSKSSSAPLLAHKNQSSVERMSDLMEIDFSKNSDSTSSDSSKHINDGIFSNQQLPKNRTSSIPVSVPFSNTSTKNIYCKSNPGYIEMRPGSFPDSNLTSMSSPLTSSKFEDGNSSSISGSGIGGYLEMKPVYLSKSPSLSSSPSKSVVISPKFLTKQNPAKESSSSINNKTIIQRSDYMNISPTSADFTTTSSSASKETLNDKTLDIDTYSSTPEGYIEMSWNKNDNRSNNEFTEPNPVWLNRSTSMPIDIKNKSNQQKLNFPSDESNVNTNETGTFNSDSSSSCNQNIMFSLSPCSPPANPISAGTDIIERKCLVDASNGTVTLLNSQKEDDKFNDIIKPNNSLSTIASLEKLRISSYINNPNTNQMPEKNETLLYNYTDMSLNLMDKRKHNIAANSLNKISLPNIAESADYVNFLPKLKSESTLTNNVKPIKPNGSSLSTDEISQIISSNLTKRFPITTSSVANYQGFKPINDEMNNNNSNSNNNNNNNSKKTSPRTILFSKNNQNTSPGYELLRNDSSLQTKYSLSRPSSVNSDKISPLKNNSGQILRPNSANSECIPSSISTSSSTSTLCGGSSSTSSSSTLCGSKSQSPLATSRPQSFTDCTSFETIRPESSSSDMLSSQNNLITSRPPSVVSEKELHYASLDLPQSSSATAIVSGPSSSSSLNETKVNNSSTSGDSSTSPSPNASCCPQQPAFAYAQIDFQKSIVDGLKSDQNCN